MSSRGFALPPPAKTVVVHRNGDPFFPGRRLVLSRRRFLTWEAFLNEVTGSIAAPGAVRSLYTPRHGHRLAGLAELRDGSRYLATGSEKLKRLDYLNSRRKEPHPTRNAQGWQGWQLLLEKQEQPWGPPGRAVPVAGLSPVFWNGDLLSPPFPLLLSRSPALQWDTLLALLTEKADLQSGAVSKLCRLDGTQVSSGEELGNGSYYVAVGNEEYKELPYVELLVPQDAVVR
ncbi:DCD2B protein, partial [Zapornia atra]|nr:DCD2B protein [Zapornia atra]